LADLQHPMSSDSLIPMFEGMVERAFSRSSNLDASDAQSIIDVRDDLAKARSAAAGSSRLS